MTCKHNWTTYNPNPEITNLVHYEHGAPIYQMCVKCHMKRIGYPQPIMWTEEK